MRARGVRDGVEVVQQEIRAVDPLAATQALLQAAVTARKDDAPAAHQAALAKVDDRDTFSICGGLIQTTSG